MRNLVILFLALTGSLIHAQPDKSTLLDTWENRVIELGGTLEARATDGYHLKDESLPYDGGVTVISTLIRSAPELSYGDVNVSYSGIVEFKLEDLPADRLGSQVYYYWLSDRQSFQYLEDEERWISQAEYNQSLQHGYEYNDTGSGLSWILNWGVWALVLLAIVWLLVFLGRSQKKAKSLMSDSADINNLARENIERSAELQTEMAGLARKNAQLMEDNNVLLRHILESVSKSQ